MVKKGKLNFNEGLDFKTGKKEHIMLPPFTIKLLF